MSVRKLKGSKNRSKPWEVDVRLAARTADGRKRKYRRQFATQKEALAHDAHLRLQIASGTFGASPAPTVKSFAPRFLEWSAQHNKPSSVAAKEKDLRVHLVPELGQVRLDAADFRAEVAAFQTKKLAEGLSPKTVNNALAVLGKMLHLAAERDLVKHVPRLKKLRPPKPDADYLTFEEADAVLAAAEPHWRTYILLALRTGLRVGELLGLKWVDVDWANAQLRVQRTRWRELEVAPKGGRERVVPLTRDALAALEAHKRLKLGRPYVFDHEDGRPYTHSEVKDVVPRACAVAGVKRVTNHGLRHTFASHLVMRGQSLLKTQRLLGHATSDQTQRYAHLAPSDLHDAVQVLDGSRAK